MPPSKNLMMIVNLPRRPFTSVYNDNYNYGFDYYGDMMGYLDKRREGRPVTPEKPRLPTLDEHATIHTAKHRLQRETHGFEPDDSPSTAKAEAARQEREMIEEQIREGRRSKNIRRVRSFGSFSARSSRSVDKELGLRRRIRISDAEMETKEGNSKVVDMMSKVNALNSRLSGSTSRLSELENMVNDSHRRVEFSLKSYGSVGNLAEGYDREYDLTDEVRPSSAMFVRSSSVTRSVTPRSVTPRSTSRSRSVTRSESTYDERDWEPPSWALRCKQLHQEIEQLTNRLMETETKLKTEVTRIKKKYQVQITELEMSLDVSNRNNIELQKTIKKQGLQITEMQNHYDEIQRQLQSTIDQYGIAQRRAQALQAELEEVRINLENTLRVKRIVEQQYEDAQSRINELTNINVSISAAKSKLDAEIQAIHSDYEEISKELRLSEERAVKAQTELKHTVEILHEEQERVVKIESIRKSLEQEVKTLQVRIEEVETNALVGGKRIITKLEARIRDIELELDEEKRRHAETIKGLRKRERQVKELLIQSEEDHKNITLLNENVEKLSQRVAVYKRQISEQEGLSSSNVTRVRRFQRELESAEERAESAESNLSFIRAKHRSWVTSSQLPVANKQVYVVEEHRHEAY